MTIDYADKSYLEPQGHAHKLAQAVKRLGRRAATHPRSTFVHSPVPRVLTAFVRKQELRKLARRAA